MSRILLSLSADGSLAPAAADAALGPTAAGGLVFAVTGCPPAAGSMAVLSLARGFVPPAGVTEVSFDRLVNRASGSCCGGGCGG